MDQFPQSSAIENSHTPNDTKILREEKDAPLQLARETVCRILSVSTAVFPEPAAADTRSAPPES